MHDNDQAELDAALRNGEPQVLALPQGNFLALGQIHKQALYVGYDIETTPPGTRELLARDHRVRQFAPGSPASVPLERQHWYPYTLASGKYIPMIETVVGVVTYVFRAGSDRSRDHLASLMREAVDTVVAAGLWTAQGLGYEMIDYGVTANGRDGHSVMRDGLIKAVLADISQHLTVVAGIQLINELEV